MRTLTLLTALVAASPALAADHELGIELGSVGNRDAAYDSFSSADAMTSRGVRVGVAVHDRVAIVGGWHRARNGARLYDNTSDYALYTAFLADEFTLGAKVDVPIGDFIAPYALAQGMLFRGVAKFDDDPTDPESLGQVSQAGLAPGVLGAGGVELHVLPDELGIPVGFGVHLEFGYAYIGRMNLADIGDMKPGGALGRAGVSVLF